MKNLTRILKLEARGFKSFAKKVELPFGPRFNTILGPNGSGKSNVVDAITFVLGKSSAKSMRAEKSANLIFNGGQKGTPAKEAEVSIYFDNSEEEFSLKENPIKLSRLVKSSGNSIYKINNQVRTRQQVLELLMSAKIDPDGHNIVLQGDIVKFAEMKSEERREVIDQIAGIGVFEDKKEKALRELNKVQEKLNEIDIILVERKKTLDDLKKDRDQALKFKELQKNLKRNKATKLHFMIKKKNENKIEQQNLMNKIESEIKQLSNKIEEKKKNVEEMTESINKIDQELQNKSNVKQKELSKQIEDLKTKIIHQDSRKNVVENELRKIKDRKKQFENNLKEQNKLLNDLEKQKNNKIKLRDEIQNKLNPLEEKIQKFKNENNWLDADEINKKLIQIDQEFEDLQGEKQSLVEKKQGLINEKGIIEYEIKNLKERLGEIKDLENENKDKVLKLKSLKSEFKTITKNLSSSLNENSIFSSQLGNARSKHMRLSEEMAKLKARNIGIQEINNRDLAIKKILSSNITGVYGTVSQLGTVDSKYSLAMEVAAGSRIKSIVVSSDIVATKCINILKSAKTGVVTFLPLNKLKEKKIHDITKKIAKKEGAYGLALDLVKYDSKFKDVFKYVFGNTVVIEDLKTARKIGIGQSRMVTLDGDLLEVSGVMVGGYRRKTNMGFKEKDLDVDMKNAGEELDRLVKLIDNIEEKKIKNEENIMDLRERKALLEAEINNLEKEVSNFEVGDHDKELKNFSDKFETLKIKINESDKELIKINELLEEKRTLKKEMREKMSKVSKEISKPLQDLEDEKLKFKEDLMKFNSEITDISNRFEMYLKEKEKIVSILTNNEKEFEDFSLEFEDLTKQIKENKQQLGNLQSEQKKHFSEYKDLFAKKEKLNKKIRDVELYIIKDEEKIRTKESRRNDYSVKIALINGELEGLNREFEQYKDVQLRRSVEIEQLNSEINEFEKMLHKLGNVNLRALEIYEKVNKNYLELKEKFDKLKLEKEDVLNLMYEIESKKKTIFMKSFKAIDKHFQEVYNYLSNKREAYLELENEEDPFSGGLDIKVKLAQKRFLDIRSLSGGEKTMAALAFIFSIQDFEPGHFYLLDEVDAALDKHNSELLSKLIEKYSMKAQYIVISHNDAVISESEQIYGVSKQEGISKVVSLKI